MIEKLIYQITDNDLLKQINSPNKLCFYLGIDPTASGIHLGHIVPITLCLKLLSLGHKVIILVGGFTGTIGDPIGKLKTRQSLGSNEVKIFQSGILKDLKKIFKNKVTYVNNSSWLEKIKLKEFFSMLFMSVNRKLQMDTFASRIENNESLSMSEFCYSELQAIDFYHLFKKYGCTVQIGGKDQWGNITFGVNFCKRLNDKNDFFGITVPLITKSGKDDGEKLGKSMGNTVFIKERENFYQYCLSLDENTCKSIVEMFDLPNNTSYNLSVAEYVDQLYWQDKKFEKFILQQKKKFYGTVKDLKHFIPLNENDLVTLASIAFSQSKSYIRQKIKEKALYVNDKLVNNATLKILLPSGKYKLQIGKNIVGVMVKAHL